ncbi:hypothetical protein NE237_005785 [Protea cynaroides]|uniref:Uncharacterized protein n=1 Tax=Protea cynaroides TaxID=273540 RepID=A0A9Q0KLB3_9MAGN|nr:hypothetical protein NE237_005785 [Protea cynaroides]
MQSVQTEGILMAQRYGIPFNLIVMCFSLIADKSQSLPEVVLDNQMKLPILNGENYVEWLELLELILGCLNLDLAINEEKPEDLTDESTPDQRDYYANWQKINNMSLRLIKANMNRTIRKSILDKPTAREYLDAIKEQYVSTDSYIVSTLIAKLGPIKYN